MSISLKRAPDVTQSDSPMRGTAKPKNGKGDVLRSKNHRSKKIWIDLENSPHVPFFRPIIAELERRGCTVFVTARDCFQVCELADLFGLQYHLIGHHYGRHRIWKLAGLGIRTLQMAPSVVRAKPDLALSHGSRSQHLLASVLGIPAVTVADYEHIHWMGVLQHSWVIAPEVIPNKALCAMGYKEDRILRYPGIKEDVYVPTFRPDASIKQRLALSEKDLVVTIRPPATEAHYHNPESDRLLDAVLEVISRHPDSKVILLPRTPHQEVELRKQWPQLFKTGKIIVPAHAVNGLDLIWCSDLVVSGGGTMNREAAALGVPVYSTFRGKTGAVDEYLAKTGRLVLLQSSDDVAHKLRLVRRNGHARPEAPVEPILQTIVTHVSRLVGLEV